MKTRACAWLSPIVFAAGLFGPLPAVGESPPDPDARRPVAGFGETGDLVFSGLTELTLTQTTVSPVSEGAPSSHFLVAGSVDYFSVRGLSVGVRFSYSHTAQSGSDPFDSVSVGPRIGYNVPIGDHCSFWPSVYGAYNDSWSSSLDDRSVTVGAYAPLLYHPVPHFFVGIGPLVSVGTSLGNATAPVLTDYGLSATVGGWVGL